jgi:hypothetical protein
MVLEDTEIQRLIGGPPRLTLEDIARHPRLPEARKVYLERFLEVYGGDPFLVRLLIESGRFLVCQVTLLLEAAHDLARRETWPTVGLLKENMAMFGLASGRHIDHLNQGCARSGTWNCCRPIGTVGCGFSSAPKSCGRTIAIGLRRIVRRRGPLPAT